ncbi:MAG: hypothetical protein LBP25_06785 [Tannerellaceae bacterium]|jgi:hypothetical protein|nr:hypothetical protein [Tannerellaceae bacterium]
MKQIKWFGIYRDYCVGIWYPGILFFLIQELPYAVMPFVSMPANPLMEMQTYSPLLEIPEKLFGLLTVLLLILLVRDSDSRASRRTWRRSTFFYLSLFFLACYFAGWCFYFCGSQSVALILTCLVAMPPLYYMSLGIWKRNVPLAVNTAFFLLFHIANVWTSLHPV